MSDEPQPAVVEQTSQSSPDPTIPAEPDLTNTVNKTLFAIAGAALLLAGIMVGFAMAPGPVRAGDMIEDRRGLLKQLAGSDSVLINVGSDQNGLVLRGNSIVSNSDTSRHDCPATQQIWLPNGVGIGGGSVTIGPVSR